MRSREEAVTADEQPLTLDPEVVEDDQELAVVLDELARRDVVAHERLVEVNDLNDVLRRIVNGDTWKLMLEVEARSNERWADLIVTVARWAFEQGQRFPVEVNDVDGGSPRSG